MGLFDKLLGGGLKGLADGATSVINAINAPKEEKERALAELETLRLKHEETLIAEANEMEKAYLSDRQTARTRETEFVKATGHMDYIVWVLVLCSLFIFSFMVYSVIKGTVPTENRELIFHIFGIVEGFLLSIFSYYFGSSAGSRLKDMNKKP